MFIVFLMKLCIFDNFELMIFYHVQDQNSCIIEISNFNVK